MAEYDTVVGQAAFKQKVAICTGGGAFGTTSITCTGLEPGDTIMYGIKMTAAPTAWEVVDAGNMTVSGLNGGYVVVSTPTAFTTESYLVAYQKTTPRY